VLVPIGSTADRSNTPVSKFVRITVAPHAGADGRAVFEGKFDHDYVTAPPPARNRALTARSVTSLKGIFTLENAVATGLWAVVVGSVVSRLRSPRGYPKQTKI
jgi:hypothetical protein